MDSASTRLKGIHGNGRELRLAGICVGFDTAFTGAGEMLRGAPPLNHCTNGRTVWRFTARARIDAPCSTPGCRSSIFTPLGFSNRERAIKIPRRSRLRPMPSREKSGDHLSFVGKIARYAELWRCPELEELVSMRFSSRLRKSWARTNLGTGTISVAAELRENEELLQQVICHELAHIVASRRTGRTERPHGSTWQRLMLSAGYEPSLRLPPKEVSPNGSRQAHRFVHLCSVCGFTRIARKRMTQWRCADCVAAGLDGHLLVSEERPPA